MLLSKRIAHISIVLLVMSLSLATCFLPRRNQTGVLEICRAMQVTATVGILFGILKAHPLHKPTFYRLWLGITSAHFTWLVYIYLEYTNTLLFLVAAGVAYMMNIIYNGLVELTQSSVAPEEPEVKLTPP